MSSLEVEFEEARANKVVISRDTLVIDLADGRTITVPLLWYPRLWHGTSKERNRFEIISDGTLIHWPDLDEDLSVLGILAGHRSSESLSSLKKWLAQRPASRKAVRYRPSSQRAVAARAKASFKKDSA